MGEVNEVHNAPMPPIDEITVGERGGVYMKLEICKEDSTVRISQPQEAFWVWLHATDNVMGIDDMIAAFQKAKEALT